MEVNGQLRVPAALPPGKESWYTLDRRLGGLQSHSGRGDEEKNSQPLPGHESPTAQPIVLCYTTSTVEYKHHIVICNYVYFSVVFLSAN